MKLNFNTIGQTVRNFYQTKIQSPEGPSLIHNKIIISLSSYCSGQVEDRVTTADWLVTGHLSARVQTQISGDLAQLQPTEGDEILVILPAQEILLTQVALPKLSTYRLQQALPYALEEQVLDELDLLHFAPGPYSAELTVPVAIVKKTVIEQTLGLLQKNGIQPDKVIPAIFTLPYSKNQWQLLLSKNYATVRTGLYSGFSTELQNVETLLHLKLGEETAPEKLVIYHDKNQTFSFPSLALPSEKISLTSTQKLELAATALETGPTLNLLQAPYASTRKLRMLPRNKKAWQLAAFAFSLWLGLLFVSKLGSLMILSLEHHHLQNQITETYQLHFPQAKAVVDPKSRLETKLKKTLAQSEKSRLFQWLSYLAKTSSSIRIQSLNFQNNQLSLELIAPSFANLDELVLSLKEKGIEVKQQNAALWGSQVKATLLIEGKSA